jgi:hypothetical protein
MRLFANVSPEKENNESKCEKKSYAWRQRNAEQASDMGFCRIHDHNS